MPPKNALTVVSGRTMLQRSLGYRVEKGNRAGGVVRKRQKMVRAGGLMQVLQSPAGPCIRAIFGSRPQQPRFPSECNLRARGANSLGKAA